MTRASQPNQPPEPDSDDPDAETGFKLRLVQIRVPDVRSAAFREEAHRQSLAVAQSAEDEQDQAFIDAIST